MIKIKNLLEENKIIKAVKLFWLAFYEYRLKIFYLILLGFVAGILEGFGINALIPLFSFLNKGNGNETDLISKIIQKFFFFLGLNFNIKFLLIFIAAIFILKAAFIFFSKYKTDKIVADYVKKTRQKLLKQTLNANWDFLSKQRIGYLEKNLVVNIDAGSTFLMHFASTIILLADILIYILIALNISLTISVLILIIAGLVFLLIKPLVYRARLLSRQNVEAMKNTANLIDENMLGIKNIKSMALEDKITERGHKYFKELEKIKIKLSWLSNFTYAIIQPISIISILIIFAFLYKTSNFNLASFAVIVYAINRIFTFMETAQSKLHNISNSYPYLKSVLDYQTLIEKKQEKQDIGSDFAFQDKIEFKNVCFAYPDEKENVLEKVNFKIKKGEMLGIIGESGAGKTTMVDLLLRLTAPQVGQILVDEKNINQIKITNWRQNIGYVPQDIFLINDTIANNIKFYDEKISQKDIIEAAKMANIYDFINEQPQKFETQAGERGMELSGGQRQRIALSRVLARKPQILILDEAMSALDAESEKLIRKSIEILHGKITVIVIAHRPSTILGADKLIILEKGKITENNTPQKLLANKDSYFYKIYNIGSERAKSPEL